jgi:tetratricopeptide (TPR) repeat protein
MSAAASMTSLRAAGTQHFHRKDYANALACIEEYLCASSGDHEIFNLKARVLDSLGRADEALICVDRCLEVRPSNIDDLCNRAVLLTKLMRREEALACLDRVLSIDPKRCDILLKRAQLLHNLGRCEDALNCAHQAVSAAPSNLSALNMRGMILDDMERREEALADFLAILKIDPNNCDAITNRGIIHGRSGQFREALACYDRSLSLNPDQANAFYNRAVIRLVLGDWQQGFTEFECRWKLFPHEAQRLSRLAPLWDGRQDLSGKTILLHHEQGYGDTLQFSRYSGLVKRLGARVILAVPAGLKKLMETLPESPQIVSEGEPVPAHDYHCPLMTLPLAFGTTPTNVPALIPYLHADPVAVRMWAQRLGKLTRPKIGVVWSGRQFPPINTARDMSLDTVRPLFSLEADFICLHTDIAAHERPQLTSLSNISWMGQDLKDFADTAALIENLDLVISVDSAVAHLAGALGKPVWLMNRYASCWRWLLERTDSPWYPTMRLFRQQALGDWAGVVREVLKEAKAFIDRQVRKTVDRDPCVGAVSQSPQDILCLQQKALDQHNGGQLADAIGTYHRVLALCPDQFEALHYLGVALVQSGRCQEALMLLAKALKINPVSGVVHNHYGNVLASLGRHQEAIASYDQAIPCDPNLADSHYNRGVALTSLGQHEAALLGYTRATELNPNYAQAYNNRALIHADEGNLSAALTDYAQAIRAQPQFVDAWINQADLLRRLYRYEEALDSSEQAVRCAPNHPQAHNSHGATLANMGRYRDALASYDRALQLNPSLAEAAWNKALIQLSRGELREGWKHYESRWQVKSLKLVRRFADRPAWQGAESVEGKAVLLHHEQGFGDSIQFSRYCTLVATQGARVILSAPSPLHALFKSLSGVHEVVDQAVTRSFDFHCPLLSLPLALGTDWASIPAPARYLRAEQRAKKRWAARLKPRDQRPVVGLVWAGRPTHAKDLERSTALRQWLPLMDDRVRWISLQKEIRASDASQLASLFPIERFGEELTDFADTAALIENLDLIVTVDTAVAHLAGALGKPVWILLPYVADWRWFQDREDSPWYPTARLFRQSAPCDWAPVIERVGTEIRNRFENHERALFAEVTVTGNSGTRPRKK